MKRLPKDQRTVITTCETCGQRIESEQGTPIRKFLLAQGWTSFDVDGCVYWRCWKCGPHKETREGNR